MHGTHTYMPTHRKDAAAARLLLVLLLSRESSFLSSALQRVYE